MEIRVKRVYAPATAEDGVRILVDRVWPRGMTREALHADLWLKEVAPSTALRQWFGHAPARWEAFKNRYFAELDANPQPVEHLLALAREQRVTLLFAARDEAHNQAVALREYLLRRAGQEQP
ncbi:uroporphyrin-III methyltransferase [Thermanaerothrix daxensis]|uniref:Uroporphyrin-III methyltransferase n=1 Tax=Thermanaerothrix daxensis TaxID=869279 RepID=A0A0P6XFT9_9CHLR|nr:DUF488 domain-containing protein [Thermanaerothrix daxensis]KPL82294.1 uroporphyrin-III methyltransferase [Thermanaerothrix daxensis]